MDKEILIFEEKPCGTCKRAKNYYCMPIFCLVDGRDYNPLKDPPGTRVFFKCEHYDPEPMKEDNSGTVRE